MVLVASLYELSRPSSPSGLLRGHDNVIRVIHTFYCYESFSYLVKLRNLSRLILQLITELSKPAKLVD